MLSPGATWGTAPEERELSFPCDGLIAFPDAKLYRGITIKAAPEVVFRWLCQLRVAPYSYDWIDNAGRQSPQELTPGIDQLEVGQDVMTIFTLTDFARDKHLTLRLKPSRSVARVFGNIVVSYVVIPKSDDVSRLLVKLVVQYPRTLKGRLLRAFLPVGDLIMMRRQLLNLKRLAETQRFEKSDASAG